MKKKQVVFLVVATILATLAISWAVMKYSRQNVTTKSDVTIYHIVNECGEYYHPCIGIDKDGKMVTGEISDADYLRFSLPVKGDLTKYQDETPTFYPETQNQLFVPAILLRYIGNINIKNVNGQVEWYQGIAKFPNGHCDSVLFDKSLIPTMMKPGDSVAVIGKVSCWSEYEKGKSKRNRVFCKN